MPQLRVMFLLLAWDGQAAGELAQAMRMRPATVTGLTDRLVRHKLIARLPDACNRRVERVLLTGEGLPSFERSKKQVGPILSVCLRNWTRSVCDRSSSRGGRFRARRKTFTTAASSGPRRRDVRARRGRRVPAA